MIVKTFIFNCEKTILILQNSKWVNTTGKLFSIVQADKTNCLKSEESLTYVISNINKKEINNLLP